MCSPNPFSDYSPDWTPSNLLLVVLAVVCTVLLKTLKKSQRDWLIEQTLQCLQTLSGGDVPDFDGRVGIAGDEDVVSELHAAGQWLVTNQRVQTRSCLGTPDTDWRVQRTTHNVNSIKLSSTPVHRLHNSNKSHLNSQHLTECRNYTVSQKRDLYTFAHNFGRCWWIFEIFPWLNSSRNLQQTDCHIAHHTLNVLLHYLVKWQLSQTAIFISKQWQLWQILINALIFGHKNTAVLLVWNTG